MLVSPHIPRQPDVSVIIVNWKSADFLRKCIESIYRCTHNLSFEVIVIDNASFDDCREMLARHFPAVTFIQSLENIGFAKANNSAAAQARGRDLWLLNPDTEMHEDSLSVLVAQLQSLPEAGAVGCRLLNIDGSVQTSCVQAFPTVINQLLDSEFLRHLFPQWRLWGTAPLHSAKPSPAEAVSGACILIKKSVFDRIGGFSDRYFMYGEDLDLCFKVRQAGSRVYHIPGTTIVHFGGGSTRSSVSNFSNVMMRESVYRFLAHHRGRVSAACYRMAMAVAAIVRMLLLLPWLAGIGKVRNSPRVSSLRKWLAIFRWSIALQPLTRTQS